MAYLEQDFKKNKSLNYAKWFGHLSQQNVQKRGAAQTAHKHEDTKEKNIAIEVFLGLERTRKICLVVKVGLYIRCLLFSNFLF